MPRFNVAVRHWFYQEQTIEIETEHEDDAPGLARELSMPGDVQDVVYSDTSIETMYDEGGNETFYI